MRFNLHKVLSKILLVAAVTATGSASAIVITNEAFFLTSNGPSSTGQVFSGTFSVDTGMSGAGAQVDLTSFDFSAIFDSGAPAFVAVPVSFSLADANTNTPAPYAVLLSNGVVDYLVGTFTKPTNSDGVTIAAEETLSLTPDLSNSGNGDFSLLIASLPQAVAQGDQAIPEPGILALLGIGLIGFGARKLKRG